MMSEEGESCAFRLSRTRRIPALAAFSLCGNPADAVGMTFRAGPFLKNLFRLALRSVLKAAAKTF
jgi:hypothetical protein